MAVTRQQVDDFERLSEQIESVHDEMAVLSKGKPDNPINKFKVHHFNQLLADANSLLGETHVPLKGFAQFDDAVLPTNSDVVIVLSQYMGAFGRWRSANQRSDGLENYWDIEGEGFEDDDVGEEDVEEVDDEV